jgi:hypothetical protein
MGASIYYRSLRTVSDAERSAVKAAAKAAEGARTWLSCEPVSFHLSDAGCLQGGSKPNFSADAEDAGAAHERGLPDGSAIDLIEVLSDLSRDYNVDWEITFEDGPPVGYIRAGRCDPEVVAGVQQLVQVARIFARMSQ